MVTATSTAAAETFDIISAITVVIDTASNGTATAFDVIVAVVVIIVAVVVVIIVVVVVIIVIQYCCCHCCC